MHDDHVGFLEELLQYSGAPLLLHKKSIARLVEGQYSPLAGCSTRLAYCVCAIMAVLGKGEHAFPPVDLTDRYVVVDDDSTILQKSNFPFDIVTLPGHTPDSIGVLCGNKLFCGDAAMSGFPAIAYHAIVMESIEQYGHRGIKS